MVRIVSLIGDSHRCAATDPVSIPCRGKDDLDAFRRRSSALPTSALAAQTGSRSTHGETAAISRVQGFRGKPCPIVEEDSPPRGGSQEGCRPLWWSAIAFT